MVPTTFMPVGYGYGNGYGDGSGDGSGNGTVSNSLGLVGAARGLEIREVQP